MNSKYEIRAILAEQDYLSLPVVCDADDWCNPRRRAGRYDNRAHHRTLFEQIVKLSCFCESGIRYGNGVDRRGEDVSAKRRHVLKNPRDLPVVARRRKSGSETVAYQQLYREPARDPEAGKQCRISRRRAPPHIERADQAKADRTAEDIAENIANGGVAAADHEKLRDFDCP
jgi:hypothetical protein